MTDIKFSIGDILKVSRKTNSEDFWYEKVIQAHPEIVTEDMPEDAEADVSKQGLTENFNYELIETFKISAALKINTQDNKGIRERVIHQTGYGFDGCQICRSEWLRRPNMERVDHKKTCIAYPKY